MSQDDSATSGILHTGEDPTTRYGGDVEVALDAFDAIVERDVDGEIQFIASPVGGAEFFDVPGRYQWLEAGGMVFKVAKVESNGVRLRIYCRADDAH